jgi:hypothetical protein
LLRRQADCLDGTSFEGTLPPLESRVIVWPDQVDFGANFVREFPRSTSKQVRHPLRKSMSSALIYARPVREANVRNGWKTDIQASAC